MCLLKGIEAGADIVLASHPHVLQPMEIKEITNPDGSRRNAFVIYSLGNFISSQTTPPRNASIILNIDVEKKEGGASYITKVSYIPIWTQFQNINFEDHFIVRKVYDMLTLDAAGKKATLRDKDVSRLYDIHDEIGLMYRGETSPVEEIEPEYVFWEPEK